MRKKITAIFMGILLMILFISFTGLYMVFHTLYIQEEVQTLENMIDLVSIAPCETDTFSKFLEESDIRLSVIAEDGTVLSDTYAHETENHLQRKEVQLALEKGSGSQTRYSATTHMNFLYVAKYMPKDHCIIRLAMPLEGLNESVSHTLPIFIFIFAFSCGLAYICIRHFSRILLEPIHQISVKVRNRQDEPIQLDDYDCPELQEITSSIEEMDRKINSQIHDLENDKQMKQLFFSNASHELKTPLTSIQGYAELLKQDELTEAMRADCIDRILLESRRMTRLIQDILMISRLESNEHNGPAEIVEMQDVIQSIVKSLTPLANEKQLTITTMLKPVRVYAYKPYMEELVSNLVHNAVLYNVPRGTIHIHLSAKEENMHLTVVDTGIGIAEDEQEKVFQRFYRADTNTKKGTGLGLSIVKHIALFYDGAVRIRSVLGKGTTLSVTIPIVYN